ncbi:MULTISPECIES: type II toxin-antitoxin system PemK/MazF family toxin [Arthrobacter]|uniref:Type II toxin-antitoxin system PemK/MazF family toxin n=2 Tax=Arthrobacter TaxID=1663 RepID=A0ABU9KI26_9MICC|nr:type II toxin-antitoxin system PemK/MazF family toxin [Arthrobacter sp. YJM1]MDP5226023.1 type II toxin-antitoxin system PemK/MazF family toxin [Arthrobacter sp. YJM1]
MAKLLTRILRALGLGRKSTPGAPTVARYPGDYRGKVSVTYSPAPDGRPDPGEVVWTWVPFEEDHSQGKDRPVLLIGRDGRWLLGLMLTSKDRNNTSHQDPNYVDIGIGLWDRAGRPSEVKVNRVLRVDPGSIRREGSVLDRVRFQRVVAGLRGAGH